MVSKVHSGVYADSTTSGSLRAFIIDGVVMSAGNFQDAVATADAEAWFLASGISYTYDMGKAVPDTAADLAIRLVMGRATVVSITFLGTAMHVLLENASGWNYSNAYGVDANLELALQALGVAVPVSGIGAAAVTADFSAATATEVQVTFAGTGVVTPGDHLGGNEHDQAFGGATTSP